MYGLSNKGQPVKKDPVSAPVLKLNLNVDELFQQLVGADGIVHHAEPIKQEEPAALLAPYGPYSRNMW